MKGSMFQRAKNAHLLTVEPLEMGIVFVGDKWSRPTPPVVNRLRKKAFFSTMRQRRSSR